MDADNPLASLQVASCIYRIALGPRAGQKVLSLRAVAGRDEKTAAALCADAHGFSLHAGVRCGAHQRQELERLCRYITRPAISNERQLWSEGYDRIGSGPAGSSGKPCVGYQQYCGRWLCFDELQQSAMSCPSRLHLDSVKLSIRHYSRNDKPRRSGACSYAAAERD